MSEQVLDGESHDERLAGYHEKINSTNIVSFTYTNPNYYVECKLDNNKIHIIANGGNSNERDGSSFKLDYTSDDNNLLKQLQQIVDKYNISKDNGRITKVDGLPAGLGDTISIIYDSGEKIYKSSNQYLTITEDAITEIYNAFRKNAQDNGYDFTTEKSNQDVYNDATEEYLQGTWKGKHFGDDIKVVIKDKNIKIYCNDNLTDDINYVIINGSIKPNKLKKDVTEAKDENDYEEFNGVSSLRKKNDISLVAYFTKESYSTCDLVKGDG